MAAAGNTYHGAGRLCVLASARNMELVMARNDYGVESDWQIIVAATFLSVVAIASFGLWIYFFWKMFSPDPGC